MNKALAAFIIITASGLLWAGALMSAPGGIPGAPGNSNGKGYAEGEILVKFKGSAGVHGRDKVRSKVGALSVREFRGLGIQHIKVSPGLSVEEALEELRDDPDIEFAEPNYRRSLLWNPNDFSALSPSEKWGLVAINAPGAWDIQNSCTPKIGVIDTGIDYNHEDLVGNYSGGQDFGDDDNDPYYITWHGTHVSGTIGAVGDNRVGVSNKVIGVCPTANLMALKIFGSDGYAYVSDEVEAINYAIANGITLLNLSIGDPNYSFSERAAMKSFGEAGGLAIISAGNEFQDSDDYPIYPAAYDLPYIVSVAASNTSDDLAVFGGSDPGSNFGFFTVDLAAPGKGIYSTYPGNNYANSEGTSMSAPYVTGVAALINTVFPELDNLGIKNQLLGTVDEVGILNDLILSGGRLNAYSAVANKIPDAPTDLTAVTNVSGAVLDWTDNSTDEDAFRIERMASGSGYFEVINTIAVNSVSYLDADLSASTSDYYRVRAIKNIPGPKQIRSMPTDAISPALGELIPPPEKRPVPVGGGGGGGCFIATAAYGSYISPELVALRSFRDNVLGGNDVGRELINLYYRNSLPLAETIRQTPALKTLMRGALVPVVMALGHPLFSATALLLMIAALLVTGMINNRKAEINDHKSI